MKNNLFLLLTIMAFQLYHCDNPFSNDTKKHLISGKILYSDDNPAENVTVYFSNWIYHGTGPSTEYYTATTNKYGNFYIDNIEYSGKHTIIPVKHDNSENSRYSFISDMTVLDVEEISDNYEVENIYLDSATANNTITGATKYLNQAANNSLVHLIQVYSSHHFIDTIRTDENGEFSFNNILTGTYYIYSSYKDTSPNVLVSGESEIFYCKNNSTIHLDTLHLEENAITVVDKPVIYIYPEEACQYEVNLKLKDGIKLTETIPEYESNWNVYINEDGTIDDKYDYLFYEVSLNYIPSFDYGYCISKNDLAENFSEILSNIGLNDMEISDFIEYWEQYLIDYEYYQVYPVINNDLNQFVELEITPEPKNIIRVWLFFKGYNTYRELKNPEIDTISRDRSLVVEWGGSIIK